MKMCSLFDGSGGFPLAGVLCGIEPIMASEVEPYPIAVTRSRFPRMIHIGDVSKVNGADIEPVDLITFGSPCQDLSLAGKRAGLKHEGNGDEETTRSGLFMEAIRIIKEMREATNGKCPTFALWENVPGAFSSNKGEDFRVVLEEFIKIKEPAITMPPADKNGWPYADVYVGDGWSLAYRTFDAQYWGVPQRRRRIYLVADFRGERAGKILFEREGLRGHSEKSGEKRERTAADAEESAGAADTKTDGSRMTPETPQNDDHETPPPYTLKIRQGCEGGGKGALIQTNKSGTLSTHNDQYLFQPVTDGNILDDQGGQQITVLDPSGIAPSLYAGECRGGGGECYVLDTRPDCYALRLDNGSANPLAGENVSPTIRPGAGPNGTANVAVAVIPIHDKATRYAGKRGDKHDGAGNGLGIGNTDDPMFTLTSGDHHAVFAMQGFGDYKESDKASGLKARDYKDATDLVCFNVLASSAVNAEITDGKISPTLMARAGTGGNQLPLVGLKESEVQYIVRRLAPTECCRLQGFPDGWGEIDSKEDFTDEEYKFWYEVRNTHAAINGKKQQAFTKQQMITWYNKLHTDSAEYKMWGNGIALPDTLYVMEGIADALERQKEAEHHEEDDCKGTGKDDQEREIPE